MLLYLMDTATVLDKTEILLTPKLYKSIIEDVIEGVSELFAEEGVDEQVLKELKQLWETKVIQSKATEGFFRDCSTAPQFVLQLPQNLHQSIHTSTVVFDMVQGVRNIHNFGTNEMNSSGQNSAFTLPPGLTYPIHLPAGMTVQTASGQVYKVTVPVMVTQAPGATRILQQQPAQHYFQHMSHSTGPATSSQFGNAQAGHNWQPQVPQVQRPVSECAPLYEADSNVEKHFENNEPSSFTQQSANIQPHLQSNVLNQPLSGLAANNFNVMPPPLFSTRQMGLPMVNTSDSALNTLNFTHTVANEYISGVNIPNDHVVIGLLLFLNIFDSSTFSEHSVKATFRTSANAELSHSHSGIEKQILHVEDDIIQVDGAGDTSSEEDVGNVRDIDENELLGIIDTEDLKALEEEDTASNGTTSSSSDDEDPEIDVIEEDPLNSGDDVSEQEVPDLFDTDNVIVCQYDKIHRSKNKWKFYLKDGVMCFGGKDYVFSKAIGEAEW
ncbi:TFIIA-alpha and beta-like factor [Pelobates cultripes]|uniref:TFIIA-alpha and beta-like factor n=1 Tax=Pelobates cultripes TaxID=61616 RepID=A0AAD1RHW2_PELCU|nr:TFIIA-alpha and beta-like factor [Pelobates cultripes]